ALASLLQKRLRPNDKLGRYGGEEFCAILPETTLSSALHIAEDLRSLVAAHPFVADENTIEVTISVGVGALEKGMAPEDLYKRADEKLYEAKRAGRNRAMS
ncbi:MAG: GGDEF domain-containing protein, partial [Xanthomonadaceae bacterium]|nr:GGDEF domain-containing protein [Xanthomonadaceae bacterium]